MSLRTITRTTAARLAGGQTDILAAACLWGTTGTVRTAAPAATNLSIATIRIVLGGAVLLAFTMGLGRRSGLRRLAADRSTWLPLLAGAAAMVTYQTAFFSAAARTGVAIGTVVTIGSAPPFAGLLGLLAGRAGLTRRWCLATAGAVVGCAALVSGGDEAGADPVGIGLALLSGLSYAVYATLVSHLISRGEDDRAVVAALFGLAAVIVLPLLLAGSTAWMLTSSGAVVALYLGVVATAGAYLCFARGLRTTPATTATTLTLAEPAVAAVLGVLVLDERLGGAALAGLLLLAASLTALV